MSGIHTIETKLLVELQEKDSSIDAMNRKINFFPEEIASINEKFEEKKRAMEESKNLLFQIQVEKKDKEISMAQKEEDIKKHQRELNLVKENNAFKALLTEIERDKEEKDILETEILVLLEKIDKATIEDKKNREEFKKKEEEKSLKIKEIDDLKIKCEAELEIMVKERGELAAKISEDMILKYEHIRDKKGNAIVEAKEESGKYFCGGCNIALVPQRVVDVKKKDFLGVCDNCQRMLYFKKVVFEEILKERK
ncbi:MAG: hypothetical protein L6420_01445 [Elusimicrobia bacterium]|nr:hypothetical protein [Elusimicrobiota bacterium]